MCLFFSLIIYNDKINFILKNAKTVFSNKQEEAFFIDKSFLTRKKIGIDNIHCRVSLGINSFLTENHIDTILVKNFKKLEKTQK